MLIGIWGCEVSYIRSMVILECQSIMFDVIITVQISEAPNETLFKVVCQTTLDIRYIHKRLTLKVSLRDIQNQVLNIIMLYTRSWKVSVF